MLREYLVKTEGRGLSPMPRRETSEEAKPINMFILDFFSLQNCEKINFCSLSCGTLLWQPEEISTHMYQSTFKSSSLQIFFISSLYFYFSMHAYYLYNLKGGGISWEMGRDICTLLYIK